jgi:hypothetical protein
MLSNAAQKTLLLLLLLTMLRMLVAQWILYGSCPLGARRAPVVLASLQQQLVGLQMLLQQWPTAARSTLSSSSSSTA